MSNFDYIFCPLCGSSEWIVDKADPNRLESHKCSECKKFSCFNFVETMVSPVGLKIFSKQCHSVTAIINKYRISVFFLDKKTEVWDEDGYQLIITINKPLIFNWYRTQEVLDKIKKYLVFS